MPVVLFPELHMEPEAICVRVVRPSVRTSVPGRKHKKSTRGILQTGLAYFCVLTCAAKPSLLQLLLLLLMACAPSRQRVAYVLPMRPTCPEKLRLRAEEVLQWYLKFPVVPVGCQGSRASRCCCCCCRCRW